MCLEGRVYVLCKLCKRPCREKGKAELAKFPALFSSALCWAFNVFLPSVRFSSNYIPCGVWSLGWKADGARILGAKEAVVLHRSSRNSTPHMAAQQGLVRSLIASLTLTEGVGNDLGPYVLPNISPHLPASDQLSPPQTAKHGYIVLRMVSHHMQRLATMKPLLYRIHFTQFHN